MFSKQLVHLKHVGAVGLKYHTQGFITNYLSLVTWVLEVIFPYVCPQLPHNLKQKQSRLFQKLRKKFSFKT